jgi:hypothetical protein
MRPDLEDRLVGVVGLSANEALTPDDAERVLELAVMTIAADEKLDDAELAGLKVAAHVVLELAGRREGVDVDALLERYLEPREREATVDRMRAVGAALTPPARVLAYQLCTALAMADDETSDQEFEFDFDLQDALELDPHEAERLAEETRAELGRGA